VALSREADSFCRVCEDSALPPAWALSRCCADKGATTKPIEKVRGVIHSALALAVIFYVLAEVIL